MDREGWSTVMRHADDAIMNRFNKFAVVQRKVTLNTRLNFLNSYLTQISVFFVVLATAGTQTCRREKPRAACFARDGLDASLRGMTAI